MDIRSRLTEIQKSRKRRLPINESPDLSEVQQQQQPKANLKSDSYVEENSETNMITFEQGVTNKGNVAIWHAGFFKFYIFLKLLKILRISLCETQRNLLAVYKQRLSRTSKSRRER